MMPRRKSTPSSSPRSRRPKQRGRPVARNPALPADALGDLDSILGSIGRAVDDVAASASVELPAAAKSANDDKKPADDKKAKLDYGKALESGLADIRQYINMNSLAEDPDSD